VNLSNIKAVIADMDGVLWRGDAPLPGLLEFFALLRARNLPFALATNNSAKSPADYVSKLQGLGVFHVREEQILTSGTASVSYLQANYPPGIPVYVLGGDGLRKILSEAGYAVSDNGVRVVIVGLAPQLTYDHLKKAVLLIGAGADFIGTNPDSNIPTPEGLAPGAGSIIAAVQTATDCEPVIIGKPHPPIFQAALRFLGTPPAETLMIGDRLTTDIEGAQRVGLRTALVLTGVSTREELAASAIQPDRVYEDLITMIDDLVKTQ
jgi:4-nitrophenyl phosphatase